MLKSKFKWRGEEEEKRLRVMSQVVVVGPRHEFSRNSFFCSTVELKSLTYFWHLWWSQLYLSGVLLQKDNG